MEIEPQHAFWRNTIKALNDGQIVLSSEPLRMAIIFTCAFTEENLKLCCDITSSGGDFSNATSDSEPYSPISITCIDVATYHNRYTLILIDGYDLWSNMSVEKVWDYKKQNWLEYGR